MSEFRKFDKVRRIGKSDTDGILEGTVWVAPKLDGTNGSVWYQEGKHGVGSRNRDLTVEGQADNAGFREYAYSNLQLKAFLYDHAALTVYGEWLVPHTIKAYQDDAWRKFYVYDMYDWDNMCYLNPREWQGYCDQYELDYVPHYPIENPTMVQIEECLEYSSQFLMQDKCYGEGIVLKNFGFTNKYGEQPWGKYINDMFQNRPKKVVTDCQVETDIALACITEAAVTKCANKIKVNTLWAGNPDGAKTPDDIEWDRKTMIPRLMQTMFHDLIEEQLFDQLKKMKMPIVNFKKLQGTVSRAIKDNGKEYF